MASGTVQSSFGTAIVKSNTCTDVIAAYAVQVPDYTQAFCSRQPVTAGTKVFYTTRDFGVLEMAVTSIDATAPGAANFGDKPLDFESSAFLLQAILVFFAVYMIFRGYDSGLKQ